MTNTSTLPEITGVMLLDRLPTPSRWRPRFFWLVLLLVLLFLPQGGMWNRMMSVSPPLDVAPVHYDQTSIHTPVRQVIPTVTLIYRLENGALIKVPVHAQRYSEFVQRQQRQLDIARRNISEQVKVELTTGLSLIFDEVKLRIPEFADFYYRYQTSYWLLYESVKSTIRHLTAENTQALVTADIEELLRAQFNTRVLKPEITDPEIQRLYQQVKQRAHQNYLRTVALMQEDFQVFLAENTTYLSDTLPVQTVLLDWVTPTYKLSLPPDMTTALGAFRGIALVTGTALLGKTTATAMAAPFVARGLQAAPSVITLGGGGAFAGPLGLLTGAVVGLAVDVTLQKSIEILSRDEFSRSVQAAVHSTEKQWQEVLVRSLTHSLDRQFEDTRQLLLQF